MLLFLSFVVSSRFLAVLAYQRAGGGGVHQPGSPPPPGKRGELEAVLKRQRERAERSGARTEQSIREALADAAQIADDGPVLVRDSQSMGPSRSARTLPHSLGQHQQKGSASVDLAHPLQDCAKTGTGRSSSSMCNAVLPSTSTTSSCASASTVAVGKSSSGCLSDRNVLDQTRPQKMEMQLQGDQRDRDGGDTPPVETRSLSAETVVFGSALVEDSKHAAADHEPQPQDTGKRESGHISRTASRSTSVISTRTASPPPGGAALQAPQGLLLTSASTTSYASPQACMREHRVISTQAPSPGSSTSSLQAQQVLLRSPIIATRQMMGVAPTPRDTSRPHHVVQQQVAAAPTTLAKSSSSRGVLDSSRSLRAAMAARGGRAVAQGVQHSDHSSQPLLGYTYTSMLPDNYAPAPPPGGATTTLSTPTTTFVTAGSSVTSVPASSVSVPVSGVSVVPGVRLSSFPPVVTPTPSFHGQQVYNANTRVLVIQQPTTSSASITGGSSSTSSTSSDGDEIETRLRSLQKMKESGRITAEEYRNLVASLNTSLMQSKKQSL